MSWTLSLQPPKNEALLARYFVAVGKALCVAGNFEGKCHHVLRMHRITNALAQGKTFDEAGEISKSFKPPRLNDTIKELSRDDDVTEADTALLHRAREARNYIAHEAGTMDEVWWVSDDYVYERVRALLPHVRQVAEGENVVSAWTYEMCEREPAPSGFTAGYVDQVVEWVFQDLIPEALKYESSPPAA